VRGGSFSSGFLSAGFTAAATPYAPGNTWGGAAFSAVVGGAGSVLGGGKFTDGALRRPAPFMDRLSSPVSGGETFEIGPRGDPIEVDVNERHDYYVNRTLEGHTFHPGEIRRYIVQNGNSVEILTYGYGTGNNAVFNELMGPPLFEDLDNTVRADLGY